jgi:undecaprenyl-diphosphatase
MNESIFRLINSFAGRSGVLDAVIIFFTDSAGIVLVFTLLLYALHAFYHGKRADTRRVLEAFAMALGAWIIGIIGKAIFASPRPFESLAAAHKLLIYGSNDSFPSGHATFYFALGAALFAHDKKLGAVAMIVAILIGLARVAAGIHWPVDILVGAVLGITIALIANGLKTHYTASR